ncbi:MAG: ATP-binding protein [Methanoregula sp.]
MVQYAPVSRINISHTDLVRLIVILSLTISCIVITAVSLRANIGTIYAQLFYFPILYATYFYQKRGLILAGICAVAYEVLAYDYLFPDTGLLIYTTGQAVLFICIAAVVAHFTEKVNRSEARYRSIFDTSLLGIVLFDQNSFAIRMTNNYLSQMLGYTHEEFAGMTLPQLFISKEEQRKFFEYLGSSEDVDNFETQFLSKNQDPLWVNLSWRRVSDNQVSCSVIDINKRKLAEQVAAENYTRYQQATELSVLDAGKIPLKYSVFSPDEMIQSIIDAGGYATKAEITVDIPHNLTFEADAGKISTVIDSMLSNAVNYSKPPRKIRISYLSNPSDKMHRVAIQDNGIGITNTQLDEIFEPFHLPDPGTISRKNDRIGLSLSIAKKYVQMHGGYISVDSIVNLGSTFTIHLPKSRNVAVKAHDA